MDREEVIKWLKIMKANLNTFPEIDCGKKIEALAEAIRLLKNEQSIDKIDCDHTDCNKCVNHKYCDYETTSLGKPNKSEIPTSSTTDVPENNVGKIEPTKNNLGVDWESYKDADGNSLDDLILEVLQNNFDCGNTYGYKVADEIIGLLPSVTQIRPKGHWIVNKERDTICCSCCNTKEKIGKDEVELLNTVFTGFRFCRYCGSDNREVEE